MPWPPWAHGGYFAPARRYGARAALARTQRGGFRSTFYVPFQYTPNLILSSFILVPFLWRSSIGLSRRRNRSNG